MEPEIVVAICSLVGTLVGSLAGIMTANRLTNYRIEQLEEKVKKHNNLVERMAVVEQSAKSAHHLLVNNDSVGGFKMEQIMNYVKPELIVVAIALYFLGLWLRQAAFIKDKYIPLVLGIVGIFVCGIWVMATATFATGQDIALAVFTAIVQGVLVAGLSTYVNQFIKQLRKDE